jgi:Protein of unknown function (DUF3592)
MLPPIPQAFLLMPLWPSSKSDWQVVLLALLIGAAWRAFDVWRERRAQSWPVVQGTVEWTQVRVDDSGRYEKRIPEVCYSYIVNGEFYSGSHEIFECNFDKYPKGSRILVHYKPFDPSISFLDLQDMDAHEDADEPVS